MRRGFAFYRFTGQSLFLCGFPLFKKIAARPEQTGGNLFKFKRGHSFCFESSFTKPFRFQGETRRAALRPCAVKTHGAENILPRVPIYVNSYVLKIVSYPRSVNGPKNFRGGTPRPAVPIQRRAFLPNFRRLRFSAILPRRCYTSTRSSNCPPFQTQCS